MFPEGVLQEKVLEGFPQPLKLHSHDYVGQLFYLALLANFPETRGAFCLPACTNQAVKLKRHTHTHKIHLIKQKNLESIPSREECTYMCGYTYLFFFE